jgi:formylglycine-generating enzyme
VTTLMLFLAVGAPMVQVPPGTYVRVSQKGAVQVAAFSMDVHAVTNADFRAFVKEAPEWSRSRVRPLFADGGYLRHWSTDIMFPSELGNVPVTNVSWFAARAYCAWAQKRLPTLAEWEYAAFPSGEEQERILAWYARPASEPPGTVESTYKNRFGLYDLHGLVWEWTEDFNSDFGGSERVCGGGAASAAKPGDYAAFGRAELRQSLRGNYTLASLGFRCAGGGTP